MKHAKPFLQGAVLCLGLMIFLVSARANAAIVPYLQSPSQDSIWVSWKTDAGSEAVVEYGQARDRLNLTAKGTTQSLGSDYQYHLVRLTDLEPKTLYYYRVKTGAETSDVYRFKTQPEKGEDLGHLRILVMGDHQIRNENRYEKMVRAAKVKLESIYGDTVEQNVNLILNVGDQVDVGTLDHYEHMHFGQSAPLSPNLPIMTTVGNHEYYYDGKLELYQAHFAYDGLSYMGIPGAADESYYAYQVGRVLFVHLNSMRTDAEQQQWLVRVMAAADQDDTVDWVISVIHHPYQAEQYIGDISKTLRNSWMAILTGCPKHVLNIGGHHHLYARGQTRDWSTYHIISGGTAWDQFWGQSKEEDYDDVQKTISNWAWQIIDIDVAAREMSVETYAEAHPIIYKNNGGQMHYNSRLIDTFHRKLDSGLPYKPAMVNTISGPITLPYTFQSTAFSTDDTEQLNSTQFQIARDSEFKSLVTDRIRDYENIYGDTGAPDYEPVDIHKGVDILKWEIRAFGLPNGDYHIRVRHRDRNTQWSEWSNALSFTVEGSNDGDPELGLDKPRYQSGDPVTVTYTNGHGNEKDWIGIYKKGQTPGDVGSTQYTYVTGPSGTMTFTGLTDGEYFAAFFINDGFEEMAPRVKFYVGPVVEIRSDASKYKEGDAVTIDWKGAPGGSKDWIGVYRMGHTPSVENSTKWAYTPAASGTVSFSGLGKGYYFAAFFLNDAYTEASDRIFFSVGDEIAQVSLAKQRFQPGEDMTVYFSNGPGHPKDYIGVFEKDALPGQTGSELVHYSYFDGAVNGNVTITQDIPQGVYFLAMYHNDSYDQVSNRTCFVVGDGPGCEPEATLSASKKTYVAGEAVSLTWTDTPGNSKDWIGIYKKGQNPGDVNSTKWAYLPGPSGSLDFTGLAIGEYFAVVLLDGGYTPATPQAAFSVTAPPELAVGKTSYIESETVDFTWANTPGGAKDWIGIYKKGQNPGDVGSTEWQYLAGPSGTASFSGLGAGDWYGVIMINDGYEEITDRVAFSIVQDPVPGDLNGDGIVDRDDLLFMKPYLRQSVDACLACDLDGDGRISILDARELLKLCTFPRCKSN